METLACSLHPSSICPRDLTPLIEPNHPLLTVSRQAKLLGLSRRSYYYGPADNTDAQALLKRDIDAIDAIYTDYPFYGSRRMQLELVDRYGIDIGRERIRRVMQLLGLEAIGPKPDTSKPGVGAGHTAYPYLLRNVKAGYPNHIWGTDITYIKTRDGFVYLVAFIDWFSRYVISWTLSDTLQNGFVLQALKDALCFVGDCGLPPPDICNSDQGSHFTSEAYVSLLEQAGIRISMDGRGRCMDNIFTERLWRSVKYENVFPSSYQNLEDAGQELTKYFTFYNNKRRHQSLDYNTPASVYFDLRTVQ
jgi:putative transposase